MNKTILYLVIIIFPFICKGESDIDNYYQRMIKDIRPLFQENDTIPYDSLSSYNSIEANYKSLQNLSNVKDQFFFIYLSKGLMGSKIKKISVKDPKYIGMGGYRSVRILTTNELDSIEKWWNDNSSYLSTDFLEDAIISRNALPYRERIRSIKNRLEFRRKMLKDFSTDTINSKPMNDDRAEIKFGLRSLQEAFNQCHNSSPHYIVEAIVPDMQGQVFVYIIKRLMSGEKYKSSTPITREEYEELKDWWFINGKNVSHDQYFNICFETFDDVSDITRYVYDDSDLPDESY